MNIIQNKHFSGCIVSNQDLKLEIFSKYEFQITKNWQAIHGGFETY